MKKNLISIVLAAVLAMLPLAGLMEATEYSEYVNESMGFSIYYPDTWYPMDKETIDEMMDMASNGEIPGIDPSMIQPFEAQIKSTDIAMFISEDGAMTYNVTYVDLGAEVTYEDLIAYLLPETAKSYATMMEDFQIVEAGAIDQAGDNTFAIMAGSYTMNGVTMIMTQLFHLDENVVYMITFTVGAVDGVDLGAADIILQEIAASFSVAESGGAA